MRTALFLALCILFTSIVAQTDDLDTDQIFPVDNRHGRLFPRILSQVQIDLLGAIELNLTLGLDLDLGLGLFKRAGSQRALTPTGVRSIYSTPGGSTAGTGKTVAIVVAYGGSTTESDLAVFNQKFSLPACTTANGCFKKVDQNGGTNIPGDDPTTPKSSSWSGETNLDVQWVHSMAPGAKIILVCANSPSSADLYPAVKTAAGLADIVSMSWGGSEGTQKQTYLENVFTTGNNNGVSFFVSTGDDGNNAGYPASSSNAIAVGGTTTLTNSDGSFASESAWSGSSGGCSAVYSMNSAQSTNSAAVSACGSKRATPDIALDADPNTGVPVYLDGSWYQYGGTSLACPLASGRTSAVKAAYSSITKVDASFIYSKAKFRDVTTGSNSQYSATTGYDRTTGLGAWNGENVPTATSTAKATTSTTKAATTKAATTSAAPTRCSGLLCL